MTKKRKKPVEKCEECGSTRLFRTGWVVVNPDEGYDFTDEPNGLDPILVCSDCKLVTE